MGRAIGAGLGLVAFLICIAITMWMWGSYTSEVVKYSKPAEEQARQIAGYDDKGKPVMQSVRLMAEEDNGKVRHMRVDMLRTGGAMEKYFHLEVDDQIIAAGPLNFWEYGYDEEMARALIQTEYQKKGQITVLRNGKKMILPEPEDAAALAKANSASAETADGTLDGSTEKKKTPPAEEKSVPKELSPLKGILR
jgi:hypothetical protein